MNCRSTEHTGPQSDVISAYCPILSRDGSPLATTGARPCLDASTRSIKEARSSSILSSSSDTTMVRASPKAASAEELKALGNEAYKREQFLRAAELYKQASELEPKEPVYLSNLSAAQVPPWSPFFRAYSDDSPPSMSLGTTVTRFQRRRRPCSCWQRPLVAPLKR